MISDLDICPLGHHSPDLSAKQCLRLFSRNTVSQHPCYGHSTLMSPNLSHLWLPGVNCLSYAGLGWWSEYTWLAEQERHWPVWRSGNFYIHNSSFFYDCDYSYNDINFYQIRTAVSSDHDLVPMRDTQSTLSSTHWFDIWHPWLLWDWLPSRCALKASLLCPFCPSVNASQETNK